MDDLGFLKEAIRLAGEHSSTEGDGPFGAVVVREGRIVGQGWNQVVGTADPTAHAEVLAIRDAARCLGTHVLDDCVIFCSCEPCPMCLSAIYWARFPRVVYAATGEDAKTVGFDDTAIARELSLDWETRAIGSRQALEEAGREVLEAWAKDPDRVRY